jgi:hypothetical protein
MKKLISVSTILIFLVLGAAQCRQQTQTAIERDRVLGETKIASNFAEAAQIQAVENWKDNPGKIVNVYLLNPVSGGLLVPPIQCLGVPNSSTESLEPNNGEGIGAGGSLPWRVTVDGADTSTTEMPGRDGTYGDPVPFRYCLSVDGNYYDWPAIGQPYLVSSASYTFDSVTIQRDFETEARLLKAEEIIKRGGCVNTETLEEQACQ